VRVRAFAPMVASWDRWNDAARGVLLLAGPVPTFVPAYAWALGAPLDHFHVNGVVLADLVAVIWLSVALAAMAGRPERGWASAFALLSVPLAVFHLTSTYGDVVLALHVAAGLLLALEYGRHGRPEDAARAMLLLLVGAMVKREGEVVAGAAGAVLLAHAAWRGRTEGFRALRLASLAISPALLVLAAKTAAVGLRDAVPVLSLFAARAASAAAAAGPEAAEADVPALFARSLFLSSNFGLLFWLWPVVAAVRLPTVRRRGYGWPLAALLLIFLESAVSSIWLLPSYTIDGTTVHRALLSVAVPAAVWLGALLTEPDEPRQPVEAPATQPASRRARKPRP